jgi:hypothetical protein
MMKCFIYNVPLYSTKTGGTWVMMKDLIKHDDGTVTVLGFNDMILQVLPDGSWNWAPEGTAGVWERATLNGSVIVFDPSTQAIFPYPIMFSVV